MNRKYLALALVMFAMLFVAQVAFAQEPTPTPNFPPVNIETDVTTLLNVILTSILGAAVASPIVATLVGVWKYIPVLKNVESQWLSLGTAAVLYILAAIAQHFELGDMFYNTVDTVQALIPILLPFILTLIGAPLVHEAANKAGRTGAPLIGYKKAA